MDNFTSKKRQLIVIFICLLAIIAIFTSGFKGQPKVTDHAGNELVHRVAGNLTVSCSYMIDGSHGRNMDNDKASEILIFGDFIIIKQDYFSTYIPKSQIKFLNWRVKSK